MMKVEQKYFPLALRLPVFALCIRLAGPLQAYARPFVHPLELGFKKVILCLNRIGRALRCQITFECAKLELSKSRFLDFSNCIGGT